MPNPQVTQGGQFAFKVVALMSDGTTATPPFAVTVTDDVPADSITMGTDGVSGVVAGAQVGTVNLTATGNGFTSAAFPVDVVAPAPTVTGLAIQAA